MPEPQERIDLERRIAELEREIDRIHTILDKGADLRGDIEKRVGKLQSYFYAGIVIAVVFGITGYSLWDTVNAQGVEVKAETENALAVISTHKNVALKAIQGYLGSKAYLKQMKEGLVENGLVALDAPYQIEKIC